MPFSALISTPQIIPPLPRGVVRLELTLASPSLLTSLAALAAVGANSLDDTAGGVLILADRSSAIAPCVFVGRW